MRNFFIIILLVPLFLILLIKSSDAQTVMQNGQYMIQLGNLNAGGGKPTGGGNKVGFTLGQTGPGLYSGTNYKVKAGFQYIYSIIPFSFSIDQTQVDFGTVSPTNPVTRTNILTVSNQTAGGYTVQAYENHPLLQPAIGVSIPNTTCDNGTCNYATSASWTSTLAYGFGYRCDALQTTNYCSSDFSNPTYYKAFPDNSQYQPAQVIFSDSSKKNQQAQVTYKINVSSTQTAGTYTNVVTYIATPTF
jgi:hypothetical protein